MALKVARSLVFPEPLFPVEVDAAWPSEPIPRPVAVLDIGLDFGTSRCPWSCSRALGVEILCLCLAGDVPGVGGLLVSGRLSVDVGR